MIMSVKAIFFLIYLIYLIAIFIDWEPLINSDYAMWGIILVLFTLVFITCIVITLYIDGSSILSLNGTVLVVILCGLLLIIGISIYYQYYLTVSFKLSIQNNVNLRGFTPIISQYGRDSQDIGMRLRVLDNELIPRNESKTLQEIWFGIMTRDEVEGSSIPDIKINKLIKLILGTELKDTIDVRCNLLWLLCISEEPFRNALSKKEIAYIMSSDMTELHEILGDRYDGAQDRASMLFTILSGQVVRNIHERYPGINPNIHERHPGINPNIHERHQNDNPTHYNIRYDQIKQYHPSIIYNLAFIQNKIINHDHGRHSAYGPYMFLSLVPESPIETIMASVINEDYNDLIEKLGIGPIPNIENMTETEKITYLQGELSLYHNVFTRASGTEQPPDLNNKTREEILNILSHYTNIELIQAYEPRGRWNSRGELLRLIYEDVTSGPKWSIRSIQNCNNDDTMNIMTGDLHGESNKHDIEDPTLSYGIQKNYRCFQASELEGSFRDYDGVFMFRVPDWTQNTIDPITHNPLIREFPLDSIKLLKTLLERERDNFSVGGLLDKIQYGLDLLKSANMQTRHLKQRLEQFTFEQRQIAELYLAWMFSYSMWMRFWKGPGSPWPLTKVNVNREFDRNQEHRSSPQERDEYIFIQEGVRTAIIEMYERDPDLKDWIESLPTIYYDFDTKEASCATHNIKSILDKIALGDYCMGFGSDTILKTAYYYITSLLDYPQGHPFDEFIQRMFPRLSDLEYTLATNQLNSIHTPGLRLQILNARLHILQQPIPSQPSFNPSTYQNNVHID